MFKSILPSIPFFSDMSAAKTTRPDLLAKYGDKIDVHTEINYKVNEHISVLSSYYGSIAKHQLSKRLVAKVSCDVEDGDMLIMFLASSEGVQANMPDYFSRKLPYHDKDHLCLTMGYCFWKKGMPKVFSIPKQAPNYFVNLLTIRGAKYLLDARGRVDTGTGLAGEAVTPKVEALKHKGAIISAFYFDDPITVLIQKQKMLTNIVNGSDSLSVGISPATDSFSRRIRAKSFDKSRGVMGDDIAMALSIAPEEGVE